MSINRGLVYKDMHPHGYVPQNDVHNGHGPATTSYANSQNLHSPATSPEDAGRATSLRQDPTISHALATQTIPLKDAGAAQMKMAVGKDEDVRDLGWGDGPPVAPLIGGLDNEHVWMLIRRFNKVWDVRQSSKAEQKLIRLK